MPEQPQTVYDPECQAPLVNEMVEVVREQRQFLVRVYALVALGLFVSGIVAAWTAHQPGMFDYVHSHRLSFQALFLFEILAVTSLSRAVQYLSVAAAWVTFLAYAIFNGMSFCVFFLFVPPGAVAFAFFAISLTFWGLMAYGRLYPDRDLRGGTGAFKTLLMGLAIVVVTNVAMRNSVPYWAMSYLGVIIFAVLISYHTDFICDLAYEFEDDDPARNKAALIGALLISLDFVNLYVMATQLFLGRSRQTD